METTPIVWLLYEGRLCGVWQAVRVLAVLLLHRRLSKWWDLTWNDIETVGSAATLSPSLTMPEKQHCNNLMRRVKA